MNYFNQLISGGGSTTWAQVGYPSASLDETAMCNAIDQIVLASAPLDARFQLGSYQSVSDLATIKSYLAAGIPVAFLTERYANFDDFYNQGEDAVFGGTGQPNNGGHFMCLLGYDDSRGENGAFYAQNSWGTSFGYQGRYWFGYKTFMAALYEAYVPTAVTQGGTGTPLTPAASGGGGGRVTNAYQATAPDGRTHLITHLELDQATQLTVMHLQGPSGSRVSFRHSLPFRSGYLYVSREDGLSFRQGTYQLELETSSGQRLSAPLSIASLPGVAEGDLGLGVTGSTGRAASLD